MPAGETRFATDDDPMIEHLRHCEECGEKFLPHVVHCSDCGSLLKDIWEDDAAEAESAAAPAYPPGEYRMVSGTVSAQVARAMATALHGVGIPVKLEAARYNELRVSVRDEERERALSVLIQSDLLPAVSEPASVAVGVEGGPCPACDTQIQPGSTECPSCGLVIGGDIVRCESCGAELPTLGTCRRCGYEESAE
jgi:hypothetical protein